VYYTSTLFVLPASLPLVAIVIASLLGAIALAAGMVIIGCYFCKKRPRTDPSDTSDNTGGNQSWKYGMPLGKQDRVWQRLVQENGDKGMAWGGVVPPPGMDRSAPSAGTRNIVSRFLLLVSVIGKLWCVLEKL